jgi:microcystin degradation protein MlrC
MRPPPSLRLRPRRPSGILLLFAFAGAGGSCGITAETATEGVPTLASGADRFAPVALPIRGGPGPAAGSGRDEVRPVAVAGPAGGGQLAEPEHRVGPRPTTGRQRPLIAVAGFSHESNSFSSRKSALDDFAVEDYAGRPEAFFALATSQTIAAGYIEGARRHDLDLYPALSAGAIPMGPVTDHAFETLMGRILERLREAPPLDGILLDLHGAMEVESYPDGDEEIVRRIREAFGPAMPIVVTHDFHANITPATVEYSDALVTYKENPHVDTFERGVQAAWIMAATVRGEVEPVQVIVHPPMIYNIVFQNTFRDPLLPIVTESKRLEGDDRILAASVAGGYQYADVEWVGPSVVVVTDGDPALAEREARRLADLVWATRDRLVLEEPDAAEAVRMAIAHEGRPVLLIDMGDNIGGGSAGDSTHLLEELLRQDASGWVIVLADPEAYEVARRAGIGAAFDFEVGGKTDRMHGRPLRIRGEVRSLHVGRYFEPEVRHGGRRYWNMGHTAVIHLDGSPLEAPNLVLLTTERSSPNSVHQLVSNGVYVERQKIIVAKGAIAPRAAYEHVADLIIPVDTPGATAVNPVRFEYRHARPGLFGLDPAAGGVRD